MKLKILLTTLIATLFAFCSHKNDRIETKIMDCSYLSYKDGGKELKKLISDYQKLLIREEILIDSSGYSYIKLLQSIGSTDPYDKIPSKFYTNEIYKIGKSDLEKVKECQRAITTDSLTYDISKLKKLNEAAKRALQHPDIQAPIVAQELLKVLTKNDFEIDFYKIKAFTLLSLLESNSGIYRKPLPETEKQKKYDLKNALKVTLDEKSEIYVNDKKVTMAKLKTLVRKYQLKNRSKSIISLKTTSETMYRTYVEVQNTITGEIRGLRNSLAKKKYNLEFDKLTQAQMDEVKNIYPQRIVEGEY